MQGAGHKGNESLQTPSQEEVGAFLINPSGRIVSVPAHLTPELLKNGFTPLHTVVPANHDLTKAESVSMLRMGGLGDALCLLPACRLLRRQNPSCKIEVRTSNLWRPLFDGLPYIDSIPSEGAAKGIGGLPLEFQNEWNLEVERTLIAEGNFPPYRGRMWANHLGLYGVRYAPYLVASSQEREWAEQAWGEGPRILVCHQASTVNRSTPKRKAVAIGRLLAGHGRIICVDPDENGDYPFSLRQVAALVSASDVVVSVDTGLLHIAMGYDRRIILLPSNMGPQSLLQETRKGIAINGECIHWPCYWRRQCLPRGTHPVDELSEAHECIRQYGVGDVLTAVRRHLSKPKKIFAVMLAWDHLAKTKEAVDSLMTFHDLDLFVVDNGSTDGTQDWLKQRRIGHIVKPGLSVAEALNVGLRRALNTDAEYILILNNDIILAPNYIDGLVSKIDSLSNAGLVVGSQVDDPVWKYSMDKFRRPEADEDFVDLVPGDFSATLIKREVVERVGGFDPNFHPRYIEDNDYALRVRLSGWQCYRTSLAFFHYLGSIEKSIRGSGAYTPQRWRQNKDYFKRKWGSDPHTHSQKQPVYILPFDGKKADPGQNALDR